jgi:hypothetical protein
VIKIKKKGLFLSLIASLMMIFSFSASAFAEGQNGTTLTASVTAAETWNRVFNWTINKSVIPAVWNLFQGDTATSKYNVSLTKDNGTDQKYIQGSVTVTNGGSVATQNLAIAVTLTTPPDKDTLIKVPVNLSPMPILEAGASYSYTYIIPYEYVVGTNYKVTADVTIDNHSGSQSNGPSPSNDVTLTTSPTSLVNDTVHVTDNYNNQGWSFNQSGDKSYERTFNSGTPGLSVSYDNTATITETKQSSSAIVTVNTYALNVSKTADTSFTRKYNWAISKTGDQTSLTLTKGQVFNVNYAVNVGATSTDSDWNVAGNIIISNPAPMPAVITSVNDVVSTNIPVAVTGTSFPYTIPEGGTLTLNYNTNLPDATNRTNTATAVLQNNSYDYLNNATPNGTTNFAGSENVSFINATMNEIDESINVLDDRYGSLGTVLYSETPKTFNYVLSVGPYDASGTYQCTNIASFVTNDTKTTGTSNWTVTINVPSSGATLTIGYWKTHAGFGPQKDMVTQYLAKWLGIAGGTKSVQVTTTTQAVQYLSMNGDASNGINKLYAQLFAAKLNIANGTDGSVISGTVTDADAFLAANNYLDWNSLSKTKKNQVLGWSTTLDNYNNGLMGVPHASQ